MGDLLTFKIYKYPNFELHQRPYFEDLLRSLDYAKALSQSINEIIITDDLENEIDRYCENRFRTPKPTRTREYLAVGKTINFDGQKKVFFDASVVNSFSDDAERIFLEQLIEIHAEDQIAINHTFSTLFYPDTPFHEVVEKLFVQWSIRSLTAVICISLKVPKPKEVYDVKMFADAFKRDIKKLHYKYQKDLSLEEFWVDVVGKLDYFIRRCIDVRNNEGNFSGLQEFTEVIPRIIKEVDEQAANLLHKGTFNLTSLASELCTILDICQIKVSTSERLAVNIEVSPKKLFKGTLVDTEPRIVAFIDILGFSAIIEEYDNDPYSNILNKIHDSLESAVASAFSAVKKVDTQIDFAEHMEYKMFSDCICVSVPYIEYGHDFHAQFKLLSDVLSAFQFSMLFNGFLVRGGISLGSYFSNENMIFSGGLVKAYKLETKAIYPIIVVSEEIIDRLKSKSGINIEDIWRDDFLIASAEREKYLFINPFQLIDRVKLDIDFLRSEITKHIKDDDIQGAGVITKLLKSVSNFASPFFELIDSMSSPRHIKEIKQDIKGQIVDKMEDLKSGFIRANSDEETSEINKRIAKHQFIIDLVDWSLGKVDRNLFIKHYFKNI